MPTPRSGDELIDVEVDEVSFVDKPANGKKFCVVKMVNPARLPDPIAIEMPKVSELGMMGLQAELHKFAMLIRKFDKPSLTDRIKAVTSALEAFNPPNTWEWSVIDVYEDRVIARHGPKGGPEISYSIPYSIDANGTVILASRGDWKEGDTQFVAAA